MTRVRLFTWYELISPRPDVTSPVTTTDDPYGPIIADFRAAMNQVKCASSERLVRMGISMAQLHILYTLERSGEMPMSRLADVLQVSLSNATGLIDRIEERGFVERTRVPEDRRVVLITVTDAGRRMLEEVDAISTELLRSVFARIGRTQLAGVGRAIAELRRALEDDHRCPLGSPSRLHARSTIQRDDPRCAERPCSRPDRPPHRGGLNEGLIMANFTPSLAEDPALGLSHRAKMEILFAVMLGLFLGALDQTIVGPALPTIATDLAGNDLYVWAITIYLLTSTISVPFWGKLSDLYGRKPMFMIGIVIFLVGSALSGLSQNMGMLILFRGIQGIGAGALFPVALAVIGDLFTPAERGKYQGLFGAVFGIAFVVGPLVGGWLTEQISWHWIFYVNIPIGLVALFVISRLLPTMKTERATRNFDILGGAIFTVAISFLLVGLTNKQFGEWTDPTVGGFILAGLIGTVLFILAEARAKEPIIPLDLFRNRTYTSSMISTFFASFAFFGAIIFLPRWFQFVHDFSPTNSGLAALPLMVGLIFSSIVSGLIVARTGHYKWLLVGAIVVMAVATALMTQLTATTDLAHRVVLDVPRRSRRRTDVLGVHDRGPERGPVQPARRRDLEPHVLPPDRRLGRPGDRRDDLRLDLPRPDRSAARGRRRAGTRGRRLRPGDLQRRVRLQPADRRGRSRSGHPGRDPRGVPRGHRALHRPDRGRHPAGVQPGGRPDVLDRRRRRRSWRAVAAAFMIEHPLRAEVPASAPVAKAGAEGARSFNPTGTPAD